MSEDANTSEPALSGRVPADWLATLTLTNEQVDRLGAPLERLPLSVGRLLDDAKHTPTHSSVRSRWERSSSDREAVQTLYSQVELLLVFAGDHMLALRRTLTPPVLTSAPWTLARGVLEASAKAMWLLDPRANHAEREARSLALRLDDLTQQSRLGREKGFTATPEQLQTLDERIAMFEAVASRRNLNIVRDRNGRVIGFGDRKMPGETELTEQVFGTAASYRFLSAAAHQQMGMMLATGMKQVEAPVGPTSKAVTQHLSSTAAIWLLIQPLSWFSVPTTRLFRQSGWPLARLTRVFETEFRTSGQRRDYRPWLKALTEPSGDV